MTPEQKQERLAKNQEAQDRWMTKLLRAANKLGDLQRERKRLLKPNGDTEIGYKPEAAETRRMMNTLRSFEHSLNDDLPF